MIRMRFRHAVVTNFLVVFLGAAICQSPAKPSVSSDPFTPEEMSIYRDFLASYNNGSKNILNIALTTEPFQANDDELSGCMKSFGKNNSRSTVTHAFPKDAFPVEQARLVDPEKHAISDPGDAIRQGKSVDAAVEEGFTAGLFTFSEIVFDRSHTHAAFSYSFHCGRLCGHGATVVFELRGGKWKPSKAFCGSSIS